MRNNPDAVSADRDPLARRRMLLLVDARSADRAMLRRVAAKHLRRSASMTLRLSLYLLPLMAIVAALISKLHP